jgi:hypothetical protein
MRRLAFVLAVLAAIGCEKKKEESEFPGGEIGVGDGDPDPPPGVYPPIGRGNLAEIANVGRWLELGARALALADKTVVDRMGTVDADVVMPIVDIDPAGTSGQVVFVRWPGAKAKEGPLRVEDAQRWVLVALTFGPDRVLDVELLEGEVERGSVEERRINALLVAGSELQKQAAGQAFFTVDRMQIEQTGEKRRPERVATVVYALALADDGPDLEVVLDEPKRLKSTKKPPEPPALVRTTMVHPKGALAASSPSIALDDPHPLTVTRAMRSGQPMQIVTKSGAYAIAADGAIERMTSAP